MPDYKEMYLEMVRATEKAIDVLIDAQQQAEELYLSSFDPSVRLLSKEKDGEAQDHIPQEEDRAVENQKQGRF